MSRNKLLCPISTVLILVLFFTFESTAQNTNRPSSSCGIIRDIRYPFRLKTDPSSSGLFDLNIALDCQENRTILTLKSRQYYVQEIDYSDFSIRLLDPGISRENLSSCPAYSNYDYDDWPYGFDYVSNRNTLVVFVHCVAPVSSSAFVNAAFCGNRSSFFSNGSEIYSYVGFGERILVSDLKESCGVDRVSNISSRRVIRDSSSLESIYDGLAYGFELSWSRKLAGCAACETLNGHCSLEGNTEVCQLRCGSLLEYLLGSCPSHFLGFNFERYGVIGFAGLVVLRSSVRLRALEFLFGFPFLVGLIVYKWRRRHLSMDKTIEEFLQGQNNLTPLKYSYSEIKKMTNNFSQRLGEGGYGTVYKGRLQSGPFVAVKIMGPSMASEQEFISEVSTIGRIHHVNIVRLIGFCVERSKCALVYEYLLNGSLDRYIFSQESLEALALRYEKMFEIALGVARGIDYLHHGCNVRILHFDIKPHNILLDESFNPKISDFGLAKHYATNNSVINITAARGTLGYMAPEMFYKNIGGVSYKADVYSFGMLLMEIAGRRKNMNPFADDVSQIYFPSWAYDQLYAGKEIEIKDATEEERKMVKKIIIVALWCIQMKPSNRPPMNKVVEMLEGDYELQMPPKPFVAPFEIAEDHGASRTPFT